uniref:Uncharacterized protein n=2 Tax=Brassica oleracea TaxID=3712 RepID=A0A0D3CFD6_BRAOL|nr:unnamed protein product [Brassica oleracea]
MVQRISIVPESTALFRPARPQNEVEDVPDIYHGARDRFSRERLIFRAGSPFQASRRRKWLSTESTSERGLVASQNLRKGEKLLFVPPSLVIRADSVWTNGEAREVMKRYDVPDWPLLATYLISEGKLDMYLEASQIRERATERITNVVGMHLMCRRLMVMPCIRHN